MIIARITGGLGNQMFQYAAGLAMASRHQAPLILDISGYDDYPLRTFDLPKVFDIKPQIASLKLLKSFLPEKQNRLFRKLLPAPHLGKTTFREPHFHVTEQFYSLPDYTYLDGYWQSEKYFLDIEEQIRTHFSIKANLTAEQQRLLEEICVHESVAVHVRRGDYLSNAKANRYHGLLTPAYYEGAIKDLKEHQPEIKFFFFSDDMAWVRETFAHVKHAHFSDEYEQQIDLLLMKSCKHQIIANSSFSWWGGWLNENSQKKVIAPARWFDKVNHDTRDLLPKSWKKR